MSVDHLAKSRNGTPDVDSTTLGYTFHSIVVEVWLGGRD